MFPTRPCADQVAGGAPVSFHHECGMLLEQCCSPSSRGRSCVFPTRPCADQVAGGAPSECGRLLEQCCCLETLLHGMGQEHIPRVLPGLYAGLA
jgi:hypothetical protein